MKTRKTKAAWLVVMALGMVATAIHDHWPEETEVLADVVAIEEAYAESVPEEYIQPDPCGLVTVDCDNEQTKIDYESIDQIIYAKAAEYGVGVDKAMKIAWCESRFDPNATNHQGSSASGLWQFTKGTWQDGVRWRGLDWTLEDRFDVVKSTDMTFWFVSREGWGRWACEDLI